MMYRRAGVAEPTLLASGGKMTDPPGAGLRWKRSTTMLSAEHEDDGGKDGKNETQTGSESRRGWGSPGRRGDATRGTLLASVAVAAGRALFAADHRVPGTALRGGDLVAAQRGLQQRGQPAAASLWQHAP